MDPIPKPKIVGKARRRGKAFSTYLAVAVICRVWALMGLVAMSLGPLAFITFAINFIDLGFFIALFFWQKWAVYAHLAVLGVSAFLMMLTAPTVPFILSIFWIALFIYMLNLDENNDRAWPQFS